MKSHTLKPLAIAVLSASLMTGISATSYAYSCADGSSQCYSVPTAASAVEIRSGVLGIFNDQDTLLSDRTLLLTLNSRNIPTVVQGIKDALNSVPVTAQGHTAKNDVVIVTKDNLAYEQAAPVVAELAQHVNRIALVGTYTGHLQPILTAADQTRLDLSGVPNLNGTNLSDYAAYAKKTGVVGVSIAEDNAADVIQQLNSSSNNEGSYILKFNDLNGQSGVNVAKNIASSLDNLSHVKELNISVGKNVSSDVQNDLLISMSSVVQSKGTSTVAYSGFDKASVAAANTALANTQQTQGMQHIIFDGSPTIARDSAKFVSTITRLIDGGLKSADVSNTNLRAEDAVHIVGYAAKEAEEPVEFNFSGNPFTGKSAYQLSLAVFAGQASAKLGNTVLPASPEIQTATAAYGLRPVVTAEGNGQADMIYVPAETQRALLQQNLNLNNVGQYLNKTQEAPKPYMKSYLGLIHAIEKQRVENNPSPWRFAYDANGISSHLTQRLLNLLPGSPAVSVQFSNAGATAQNLSSARETFKNANLTGVSYEGRTMNSDTFYSWGSMVGDHKNTITRYDNQADLSNDNFAQQNKTIESLTGPLHSLSFAIANDDQLASVNPREYRLAEGSEFRPVYSQKVTDSAIAKSAAQWRDIITASDIKFGPMLTTSAQDTSTVREAFVPYETQGELYTGAPKRATGNKMATSSIAGGAPAAADAIAQFKGKIYKCMNPSQCPEEAAVPQRVAIDSLEEGKRARFESLNQATIPTYIGLRAPKSGDTDQ